MATARDKKKKRGFKDLLTDVVEPGLCCGCGTCAGVCPLKVIDMSYGQAPDYEAEPTPVLIGECNDCGLCLDSCPGKEIPLPEFDRYLFGRERDLANEPLGIYQEIYGGFGLDPEFRNAGASGGIGTSLLTFALEAGVIDGAIVAAPDPKRPWRVRPKIVTDRDGVLFGSGSSYALVPTNYLLGQAVSDHGIKKLGVIGCPCHIEALRKIQLAGKPSKIAKAITLTIGLLCETNFSWQATKHCLFEQCGLDRLEEVARIKYRGGSVPKHFVLEMKDGSMAEVDLFTYLTTYFFPFEVERCGVCWDWGSEAADIAIGDLWEPCTRPGEPGWNVIVARTKFGQEIIEKAQAAGYLFARPSPERYTIAALGCEGKKHGHAHALRWRRAHGWTTPDFGYELLAPEPWRPEWRNFNLQAGLSGHGSRRG